MIFTARTHKSSSDVATSVLAYRRRKDWGALRRLVTSTEALPSQANFTIVWATPPTKVGSLSLAYLAEGAREDPNTLSTFVLEMVPSLLASITSGQREWGDHALLMISFTIPCMSKVTQHALIDQGLKSFIGVMSDCRSEPRLVAVKICHSLCKNNLMAQELFLEGGGAQQLVQLLVRESEEEEAVVELLRFLEDLVTVIVNGEVRTVKAHLGVLLELKVHDVLSCLVFENYRPETCEEVDKLLRILAE
jgi:hypothetical protein